MPVTHSVPIEPHRHRVDPWHQSRRSGSIDDRRLGEVTVSLPPVIAALELALSSALGAAMDAALRDIAALDETHGEHLGSLSTLLLRAEAVASSKIEQVEASMDDFARALHGFKANPSATSMVASTRALDDLIHSVDDGGDITLDAICRAHHTLMDDDPYEHRHAGRLRDMQSWIGGSDHSPRLALYVPPPPDTVPTYMDDLVAFANRDDLPVLVQAAVTHAQFESVHPFTDGNGRIGRALINTILRRRGITSRVVVPLASALVARRDDYFATLDAYREGDAGPIILAFSTASAIAAAESRETAARLRRMPAEWRSAAHRPRAGSATAKLLDVLLDQVVLSAREAEARIGGATSSVYSAIARLHDAGIIRPLTPRTRNQVWMASALAAELDDLGVRIAARARQR